jgi:thiamine pyrophosphate-dependent acetolactate synthase large subunit-like protein
MLMPLAKKPVEMMMECDTLLMIGSGFPYSEFLPKPRKVTTTARR